jgi:hypothetical protein
MRSVRGGSRTLVLAARVLYGCALIAAPRVALGGSAAADDAAARVFARLLGARNLLEAALLARHPSPRTYRIGASIDALHAASMIPLAVLDRRRRGPATASGLAGASFALAAAGAGSAR